MFTPSVLINGTRLNVGQIEVLQAAVKMTLQNMEENVDAISADMLEGNRQEAHRILRTLMDLNTMLWGDAA